MSESSTVAVRRGRGFLRCTFTIVRNALALVGLVLLLYHLCFDLSVVVSSSMAPTLQGEGDSDSDWVLCENVSYWFRRPERWEVIWFRNVDGFLVAKRVVGLPGETIAVPDRNVLIDGSVFPFPPSLSFLRYYGWGSLDSGKVANCGAGYFVMGDDSKDSADSRFDGPVDPDEVLGRAWLIVWPPSRIGWVNP